MEEARTVVWQSILTAVATPERRDKQASSSVLFNQVMEEEEEQASGKSSSILCRSPGYDPDPLN